LVRARNSKPDVLAAPKAEPRSIFKFYFKFSNRRCGPIDMAHLTGDDAGGGFVDQACWIMQPYRAVTKRVSAAEQTLLFRYLGRHERGRAFSRHHDVAPEHLRDAGRTTARAALMDQRHALTERRVQYELPGRDAYRSLDAVLKAKCDGVSRRAARGILCVVSGPHDLITSTCSRRADGAIPEYLD